MKELTKLQVEVHGRVLALRSIRTIIYKPKFAVLWELSTEKQREEVSKHIEEPNKEAVSKWMDDHPSITVSEMNYQQLLKIARKLGIPNYSRTSKAGLVQECERYLNEKN